MTSQVVRRPADLLTSQLVRVTSASVAVMLLAVAVVHSLRYALGEFSHAADSLGWLVSLLIVGVVATLRYAWWNANSSTSGITSPVVWGVATLATIAWSCSLTLLAGNVVGVVSIWLVLLTSEVISWALLLRHRANVSRSAEPINSLNAARPRALMNALAESEDTGFRSELEESVIQQLTRSMTEEHGELIHGVIRCRFQVGERSHVEHVAFCPPLEAQPSILVDQIDGPTAKVKVAQAESFGVRFEIRLDRVCRRDSDFVFEFFASTSENDERMTAA